MLSDPQRYPHGEIALVVDCADLERSAAFWCGVLGYVRDGPPGGTYQGLIPADGHGIEVLLQRVPDNKRSKNRLHLDLRTKDLVAEVQRILALGAGFADPEAVTESGWQWFVLTDPDGNEFCVLQPPAAYWGART